MQPLGQTRSSHRRDHMLLTPETFVRAPLPGMKKATAIVHVSPAAGAGFTEYTAEIEANGAFSPSAEQRFVYVLEGELNVSGHSLGPDQYVYIPPGLDARLSAISRLRSPSVYRQWLFGGGKNVRRPEPVLARPVGSERRSVNAGRPAGR